MDNHYRAYEGDINNSVARKEWRAGINDEETLHLLKRDEKVFLHQSLSTPCLDVIQTCKGSKIFNRQGAEYLDFHGNNLHQAGFANPFIIEKIKQQLDVCSFSTRRFTNETSIQCAEKLTSMLPEALTRVLFAPGGTSAIEMALKLARVVTGKYKVISYFDSFHGASLDAISAGGERSFKERIGPLMPGSICIPPPLALGGIFEGRTNTSISSDSASSRPGKIISQKQYHISTRKPEELYLNEMHYADYLEYVIEKEGDIGAFIAEPLRNTDVQIPSRNYWKRIREICNKHNILLILDEIALAFGRTGKIFAFENFDIEPDIICLGKALGGGIIPFAAIVAREEFNVAPDISLGHYTHEKSPVGAAACLATLEFIEQKHIVDKAKDDENFMFETLSALCAKHEIIDHIRGIGLLWGIELRKNDQPAVAEAEKIMYDCLARGLSYKVSKGNVITLAPALTVTHEELEKAVTVLDKSMNNQV
ncbi:MAG: aspartate aminotransferase family protein [Bacteroidetes bacterium]|nr:MAG: aspartate aminotransferase family protein [Bacteroidota bacterium]